MFNISITFNSVSSPPGVSPGSIFLVVSVVEADTARPVTGLDRSQFGVYLFDFIGNATPLQFFEFAEAANQSPAPPLPGVYSLQVPTPPYLSNTVALAITPAPPFYPGQPAALGVGVATFIKSS